MIAQSFPVSNIGLEDSANYIWLLWHTCRGFLGKNPIFYTLLRFFPEGAEISFDTPIFNSLLSLPFCATAGPIAAYNFLVLFSFITTFAGFYLFLKLVTDSKISAFLGSLIFTFSTYRLTALAMGHMDLLSTEWIGFSLYFLFRYFKKSGAPKDLVGLVFFYALGAYTDYRTFVATTILTFILLGLAKVVKVESVYVTTKKVLSFVLGSLVLLVPLIILHIKNFWLFPEFAEPDSPALSTADLFSYIYPFKNLTSLYFDLAIPFVGFLSIFLIIYLLSRKMDRSDRNLVIFFGIISGVFTVLSFGNGIGIFGHRVSIPGMPYELLSKLPVFSFFRSPLRYSLGVHISIAVISAVSLKYLFQNVKTLLNKWILFVFIFFFAIFQNFPFIPQLYMKAVIHNEIFDQLSTKPEGTVLYIPFWYLDSFRGLQGIYGSRFILAQTVHHKARVGGYLSYIPRKTVENLRDDPFVNKLLNCEEKQECISLTTEEAQGAIDKYDLKYVLVDEKSNLDHVEEFVQKSFHLKFLSTSDGFTLFTVEGPATI